MQKLLKVCLDANNLIEEGKIQYMNMMLDLYKQVTESAGDYQVKGVKNAKMLNIGGSVTTDYGYVIGVE